MIEEQLSLKIGRFSLKYMRSTDNAVLDHTRDRSFRGKPELRLHYLLLNYSNLQNLRLRSNGLTVPLRMKIALSFIDT